MSTFMHNTLDLIFSEMVPVFMENLLKAIESGIIPKERAVDETVDMIIAVSKITDAPQNILATYGKYVVLV